MYYLWYITLICVSTNKLTSRWQNNVQLCLKFCVGMMPHLVALPPCQDFQLKGLFINVHHGHLNTSDTPGSQQAT